MKKFFIAEAAIQKQNMNERHLPGHYSHFMKALLAIVKNHLIIA